MDAEKEILIKAVRVNTLSKLTYDDCTAFLGLISDVFPNVMSSDVVYEDLEAAIRSILEVPSRQLQYNESQVRKMMQLKRAWISGWDALSWDRSGCGKSTVWRVLKDAANQSMGTPVRSGM